MYASKLLKVLYAPGKTLKEVIQDPKYIGPLLIVILIAAANIASTAAIVSKEDYEQVLPTGGNLDEWTQSSVLWTSNGLVSVSSDHVNGTLYGNSSIAFTVTNSSQVLMQLNGVGPVDCSEPNGFNFSSFRIKWTSPSTNPENVTLKMYSGNSLSNYFYYNLTGAFSNSTSNIWNNVTVHLASGDWFSVGSPAWNNVTGLGLQFFWMDNPNITILIDGLYFHGPFKSLLATGGTTFIFNYAVIGAMRYIITWFLLGGLIYVLARVLGGKSVWKPTLIAAGFVLMTMFIAALVTAVSYWTLPTLRFPFDFLVGVEGEGTAASNTISEQISTVSLVSTVMQVITLIWSAALASFVARFAAELSWVKSIVIGIIAYLLAVLVEGLLVG